MTPDAPDDEAEPTPLEQALAEQRRRSEAMTKAMPHLPFGGREETPPPSEESSGVGPQG